MKTAKKIIVFLLFLPCLAVAGEYETLLPNALAFVYTIGFMIISENIFNKKTS